MRVPTILLTIPLALAVAGLLAACGPVETPGDPVREPVETAPVELPSAPSLEQIEEQFSIPNGLSDQALAEAYVDRKQLWWNYGADPSLEAGARDPHYSLEEYAELISALSADSIAQTLYTADNSADVENALDIQVNTLQKYMQTLLKESAPFRHHLELVSLDAVGDNGDIHVMRMTVREYFSGDSEPHDSTYPVEVHFVVDGDRVKVQGTTLL